MHCLMPRKSRSVSVKTGKSRNIINVELTTLAHKVLGETIDWTSLPQKDIIARLLDWFSRQEMDVRRIALGHIPDGPIAEEAKRLAVQKMRGLPDDASTVMEVIGGRGVAPSQSPVTGQPELPEHKPDEKGPGRSK